MKLKLPDKDRNHTCQEKLDASQEIEVLYPEKQIHQKGFKTHPYFAVSGLHSTQLQSRK